MERVGARSHVASEADVECSRNFDPVSANSSLMSGSPVSNR